MALILVVGDEPLIVRITLSILERAGHDVVTANFLNEAIGFVERGFCADMLIVDHWRELESRQNIVEPISRLCPAIKVIHVSGFTREQLEEEGILTPSCVFIGKPFTVEEMRNTVAQALT